MKWKIIVAQSNQYGFPGFQPPYNTRYLRFDTTLTIDDTQITTYSGVPITHAAPTVYTGSYTIAPQTGQFLTATGLLGQFPYGSENTPPSGEVIEVLSDTHYKRIIYKPVPPYYGYEIITEEGILSDPYTVDQVEAVCDQLINAIDVDDVAWNTCLKLNLQNDGGGVSAPLGPYIPLGDLINLIPSNVNYSTNRDKDGTLYAPFLDDSFGAIPVLQAIAWTIFGQGGVGYPEYYPNAVQKAVGYVMLAGNYSQKTFTVDFGPNQLDASCLSGSGKCGTAFKIVAPPATLGGPNHYLTVTPNCQCGG